MIVFLDVSAAFRKRKAECISYLWGGSGDFENFVKRASKNAKDSDTRYDYERIRRRVYDGSFETGYYKFVTEIMNAWSETAVMRFAEVLRACDAKFVLSSPFRDCFGRGAIASLLSYFPIDDVFLDMTASPDPLFRRQVMRRTDEGPAPADYLPRYRRMMRELWLRIDGEASGGVCHRAVEIREYLDRHPEITSYVAIDDQNLSLSLDGHFVSTSNLIESDHLEKILDVLSRRDGPYSLPKACLTENVERMRREALPLEEEEWFGFDPAREIK